MREDLVVYNHRLFRQLVVALITPGHGTREPEVVLVIHLRFLLRGLSDVFQYFTRAIGAVPAFAGWLWFLPPTGESHQIPIGVNPHIIQNTGNLCCGPVLKECVVRPMLTLFNERNIPLAVISTV